jgi:hypothetical protein
MFSKVFKLTGRLMLLNFYLFEFYKARKINGKLK